TSSMKRRTATLFSSADIEVSGGSAFAAPCSAGPALLYKYFTRGRHAIQRGRKSGIDCHLLEDMDELPARGTGRERRTQMILERCGLRANRGEQRDRRQLARDGIERALAVDAAARRPHVRARGGLHLADPPLPCAGVARGLLMA